MTYKDLVMNNQKGKWEPNFHKPQIQGMGRGRACQNLRYRVVESVGCLGRTVVFYQGMQAA